MKKFLHVLMMFVIFIVSCDQSGDKPQESLSDETSNEKEFSAVQDSILKNYASAVRIINQIDDELTRLAQVPTTSESYNLESEIMQKIEYLSFQLKSKSEDIDKLQSQLKKLSGENKQLNEKISVLESIIVEKDRVIESQRQRLIELEAEIAMVRGERDIAIEGKERAERFAEETLIQKNTAYYTYGTEKVLKERSVILMEGEGFLGIGGKYVPNANANLLEFYKIDIIKDTILHFPKGQKIKELVSSHSKRLIELVEEASGDVYLKIKSPETFWKSDKRLIIMIDGK
ncbi:MAG: hypothetical protein KGZ71_12865 [Desulfobulbaceae bacterium]|nr:hypothetical protein [Candidatus Kapabacteria bacterium]MBS4001362.1 hypothetical protein [Desulfobulbaceae bacterium]